MDNWNSGGYSFDTQSSADIKSTEDDEMAAFEAECERRLEAEHKRRAEEKAAQAEATEIEVEISQINEPEKQEATALENSEAVETVESVEESEIQFEEKSDEPEPVQSNEPVNSSDDDSAQLSAIMQEESDRQKKHVAFTEAQNEAYSYDDEESKGLPNVVRFIFTVMLISCGCVGICIMTSRQQQSYFVNSLCFTEASVCLLGALGLNTSRISNRLAKSILMKLAALLLFVFYCIYAIKVMSLIVPLRDGFGNADFLVMLRDGISFDIAGDIRKMGSVRMADYAAFVVPFAFFVLLMVRPMRNVSLYFPMMAMLIFGAGGFRIITQTGYISLSQSVVCLVGAAVSYFIFMLSPMQGIMRRSGLIGWIKVRDED